MKSYGFEINEEGFLRYWKVNEKEGESDRKLISEYRIQYII